MIKLIPLLLLLPLIAFAAERSGADTSVGDTPTSEDEAAKNADSCGGKSKCGEMACAGSQAPASRDGKLELPKPNSQAGETVKVSSKNG